jgi:hypothetical protein
MRPPGAAAAVVRADTVSPGRDATVSTLLPYGSLITIPGEISGSARGDVRPNGGIKMLAIIAAVVFAIALVCDWAGVGSDFFNYQTLDTIGLLLIALHLAGVGTGYNWRGRGRRR